MNRVIRRTCLSALVLAAMTVFAGCAAETGDADESAAGPEQAGNAPKDGDGEAIGSAEQPAISQLVLNKGEKCAVDPIEVGLETLNQDGTYSAPELIACCPQFAGAHTTDSCGDICFSRGRCSGRY
jgi:hypothetical protein